MKFDLLTLQDVPKLLQIEQSANPYPWSESAFISSFANSYFSYKLLDDNGVMLGFYFAQLIVEQLELFNICVATDQQGRGFGKALLQHFLHEGRCRGGTEAFLEVRSSNLSAIALYEKFGFQQTAIRKAYYVSKDSTADAVLMSVVI